MYRKLLLIIFSAMFIIGMAGCASKNKKDQEESIPVKVQAVARGQVVKSLEYTGDIKAKVEVKVFSKVPNNRIEKLYADEGDYVEEGGLIASISAPSINHGLEQAKASLAAVKAQLENLAAENERAERLYNENAMSKQQYDAVKSQYEATQAQLDQTRAAVRTAESNVSDTEVRAPIAGIIGQKFYEAGDMINMAQPLVTVVQMRQVKTVFNVTEEDLGKLADGQKAEISVKSYPDTVFTGKVIKISPVLDPLTRMAEVEVLVDNPDLKLKPGMFARIRLITGTMDNVIVVPRYATIESTTLERENGKDQVIKNYFVFVAVDSVAQQRKLDVIHVNNVSIAVDSGVQVGEKLIVQGQNNLKNESKIAY